MVEDCSVAQKLGCGKYALDNCILVKAPVEAVSTIVQQYFVLEVQSNCKIADYVDANKTSWAEVERQRQVRKSRPNKSLPPVLWAVPFWRYLNHQWTILPLSGREESIAFALALLLNTDTITFYDSSHASYNEFKVFRKDQLVEYYLFGFECGKDFKNDWDIKVEDSEFDAWNNYEHRFKSSIRQVTEAELRSAFLARKPDRDNRGFLDACLKHYRAYIPLQEETPRHYHLSGAEKS
ncbi:MAG: hypothetical protein KME15_00005 [Drouetiella hepatica Uher 2000/2452]|jgi:hypothetical protein|uniref:Uncharacterized protein n=1 Tax=Drouetiella hepatica Uher 2000/2452 TaxID=904376 RepID=A0A951Q954_9CYAN|nr:hypothetical protein [Drouetiella hepatica Uher 2000/2452]